MTTTPVHVYLDANDRKRLDAIAERRGLGVAQLLARMAHASLQPATEPKVRRHNPRERRAHGMLSASDVRMIELCTRSGASAREVAELLGIHERTVYDWRDRLGLSKRRAS